MPHTFDRKKPTFLFDLDGTLADTALDLGHAVNHVRAQKKLAQLPLDSYRPYASQGARGLLQYGLGLTPEDAEFESIKSKFLDFYGQHCCVYTTLFPNIISLIHQLRQAQCPWGIVTNKAFAYAQPLVKALSLDPPVLIGGDSTPFLKPSPEPLWLACDHLGVRPENAWYIGDDERDILAGKAAGMKTVSIGFGYLAIGAQPLAWSADHHCQTVEALMGLIDQTL